MNTLAVLLGDLYINHIDTLMKQFTGAQNYFEWVVANPQNWHNHQMAIADATELLLQRAQEVADYEMYTHATVIAKYRTPLSK